MKSLYFECKQTTEMNNVDSLSMLVAELFDFPRLAFQSMEELLEFLFQKSKDMELILVLDEYPYLRETIKGLDKYSSKFNRSIS